MREETRKTYIDNNGFERYEDNCKLVTNGKHNTGSVNEIYNTFIKNNVTAKQEYYGDYENAILKRQENNGIYDL